LAALRRLGFRKTLFGLAPSARFCSSTFGAGVVASQRPITCPKRQLQPERYAPVYNLDDEVFFPSYHHSQNAS